jgi:glycerophosphoryl diester phosphodiesterase
MAPTLICAHRGNSGFAPENTLVAIRQGADLGADLTEIDVRRTSDGHLVLLHDDTVDRTTNGTGPVCEITLADVRALDAGSWKGPEFAGERIPTLGETLALCRQLAMPLMVEIKQDGIAADVVSAIEAAGTVENTIVISFSFDTVAEARRLNAAIPCGWLTGQVDPGTIDAMISRCLRANIMILSAHYSALTPEVVRRLRIRGITVYAWTIDDPETFGHYADMGVDVIASNRPGEMRDLPAV